MVVVISTVAVVGVASFDVVNGNADGHSFGQSATGVSSSHYNSSTKSGILGSRYNDMQFSRGGKRRIKVRNEFCSNVYFIVGFKDGK